MFAKITESYEAKPTKYAQNEKHIGGMFTQTNQVST